MVSPGPSVSAPVPGRPGRDTCHQCSGGQPGGRSLPAGRVPQGRLSPAARRLLPDRVRNRRRPDHDRTCRPSRELSALVASPSRRLPSPRRRPPVARSGRAAGGIQANGLAPGYFDTDPNAGLRDAAQSDTSVRADPGRPVGAPGRPARPRGVPGLPCVRLCQRPGHLRQRRHPRRAVAVRKLFNSAQTSPRPPSAGAVRRGVSPTACRPCATMCALLFPPFAILAVDLLRSRFWITSGRKTVDVRFIYVSFRRRRRDILPNPFNTQAVGSVVQLEALLWTISRCRNCHILSCASGRCAHAIHSLCTKRGAAACAYRQAAGDLDGGRNARRDW